jgi:uncharacterized protein (TIGR04255 family)
VLELPVADDSPLATPPLDLVVCQVRFDETYGAADSRVARDIHKDLGGREGVFSRLEQVKTTAIEVSVGGPPDAPRTTSASGWRMSSEDATWTATLLPDSVGLETSKYIQWKDFAPLLAAIVDAVQEHVRPTLTQRIGLRYINRFSRPEVQEPSDWSSLIAPEFLGPVLHPILGRGVKTTLQQLGLHIANDIRATVRHGVVPEENGRGLFPYLLDIDIYDQSADDFDAAAIKTTADRFNDVALRLFQLVATPKLISLLDGASS